MVFCSACISASDSRKASVDSAPWFWLKRSTCKPSRQPPVVESYHATGDMFWVTEARRAFEWFLGRNDLGLALYDSATGGCRDGLHVDRLSQNQGAESTLAFLLALAEMQALQNTIISFKEPAGK